jgi:hypothetical protein
LGLRCSGPFGVLGAEVSGRRLSKLFEAVGVEASEPRCRGPSGLLVPRLLSRSVGGSCWVLGALRFKESWCGRLHGGMRCHGFFGAWDLECSERAAFTWLKE